MPVLLPLGLARLVKGAPEVILEHCDTADELAAMREEIARKINQAYLSRRRLSRLAQRGGTCRAGDRIRPPPAGRTAPSSRPRRARRSPRTCRRARSGSAPPHG